MCTVSWFFDGRGYELFGNRDESRLRSAALRPRLWQDPDGSFLAPEDTAAGGSWVSVNELGLSLCLLNLYEVALPAPPSLGWTSRGLLVTRLATASEVNEVSARLAGLELAAFRPFNLVVLAPGGQSRLCRWDGVSLSEEDNPAVPLSSSGFDAPGAAASRRSLLAELAPEGADHEKLLAFHQSHAPERGPYSPCMHRPDAVTVSFTWVKVEPERVMMAYAAGSPCVTPLGEPLSLERAEPR